MSTEGRKYFFDLNNFDGTAVPEPEEDLPPPPPVFSEDELAAAQAVAFEEGRVQGHQEEQQSRAQYIATQISDLNTQILSLVLSEQIREKKFEQEVIHVCRALVSRMFPALTAHEGYNEIESIIQRVISKQPISQIHIEVPKDGAEDIKTYLLSLKDIEPNRLHIMGADDLPKGSCRMKWQDGGATRDHDALAKSVFAELDQVLAPLPLAPAPQKVQNSESEQKTPPDQPEQTVKADNGEENG